jgi:hypothetical protein
MVDFRNLTIPIIIALIVGGTISFFLAYSFYPEKHVNVKIDGHCYEFLDNAYEKYKKLQGEKEILTLRLEANSIESPSTKIPVIFSGTRTEVDDFVSRYNMNATSSQVVGANKIYIDRHIVKATISKQDFERLINDINVKDLDPLRKTIIGSLGLQPGSLISAQESKQISSYSKDFMRNGIQQIVNDTSQTGGVKQAECRTKIQY